MGEDDSARAASGEAAHIRLAMQEVAQMGDTYLHTLLKNIKFMLLYVQENGIAVPEELRAKLATLLTHPELDSHPAAAAAASSADAIAQEAPAPPESQP